MELLDHSIVHDKWVEDHETPELKPDNLDVAKKRAIDVMQVLAHKNCLEILVCV
jgi:hypothetical protein